MLDGKLVIATDKGIVGYLKTEAKDIDGLLRETLKLIASCHKDQKVNSVRFEHTLKDKDGVIWSFENLDLTDDIELLTSLAL